jgi:uncharacterized protein YjbI with pentapeptide repeats
VSFFGFMLLGPAVLIMLRIYLQMYVEHGDRLDRLARSVSADRAPTLVPLQNPLIRLLSALTFYALLPVAMLLFAWKAAVFPAWGSFLGGVTVAVIWSHSMLIRLSWLQRALKGACLLAAGALLGLKLLDSNHRPFELFRADLSDRWLPQVDLHKANLSLANLSKANLNQANLSHANLSGATLSGADLSDADLSYADLSGETDLINTILTRAKLNGAKLTGTTLFFANLSDANLSHADLSGANLSDPRVSAANVSRNTHFIVNDANLSRADLSGANLSGATLSGVQGITQRQLDAACGDPNTKLPEGFTLKPCATN